MAYDLSLFTKLIGQAGSSAALQTKFPYLCDIHSLANALQTSTKGPLIGARNPNGYDKYEMAYQIINWFDTWADYPSGKAPKEIQERFDQSGITWSQGEFWTSGIYTVEQDLGYPISSISVNEPRNHYFRDVTANDIPLYQIGTQIYNGSFNATKELFFNSSVDYLDHVTGPETIDIKEFHMSDIKSFYWRNLNQTQQNATDGSGLFGVDDTTPSFVQTNVTEYYGYGLQEPGTTAPVGSTDNVTKLISSNRPPNTETIPTILADPTDFIGELTNPQWGSDPSVALLINDNCYFEQYHADHVTWGSQIPFTSFFDINGDPALQNASYITRVSEDGINWFLGVDSDPENLGNGCEKYNNEPLNILFQISGTFPNETLGFNTKTDSRYNGPGLGWEDLRFRGLPVYRLWVRYFDTVLAQEVDKEVYVAINHFTDPTETLWDFNIYGATLLLNNEGSQLSAPAVYLWDTRAKVNLPAQFIGRITHSVEVSGIGIGTDFAEGFVPIEYFGRKLANPFGTGPRASKFIFPTTDALIDSEPLPSYGVSVSAERGSLSRLPRPITTILHSDKYLPDDDTVYQHSWFGTDNEYEDTEYWAREVTLTNNRITDFGAYERSSETSFIPSVPGYVYDQFWVEETLNPNGLLYAYEGGPYGTKGEYDNILQEDFLTDIRWNSLNLGVFDVNITDGRIFSLAPINRTDGDGLANPGGWGYGDQRIALTFVRNNSVPLNSNTITPKIYYNTEVTAANGVGNRADVNPSDTDQFTGLNLPNNAYLFAIAYGQGESSPLVSDPTYSHLDGNDADTANQRPLHPGFYPAEITITSERPVLRSTTRSLIDNVRSTGAQRYRFEYKYPPMTQESARSLIASFEKFRGGAKAFQIRLPRVGVKLFQQYANDPTYSSYIAPVSYYAEGENEIKLNGFPTNEDVVNQGTFFRFVDDNKLYQIVEDASSNQYGEATFRIEPSLKAPKGQGQPLIAKTPEDYLWITVRFADDEMEYTTNGTGLFQLTFKFVEALA